MKSSTDVAECATIKAIGYRLFALLAILVAAGGCAPDRSVVDVTLDMDRDRCELPHTAERVNLRSSKNMTVRVELINSTDKSITVERVGGGNVLSHVGHLLYRGEVILEKKVSTCYAGGDYIELEPGQSAFHHLYLGDYALEEPLPAGKYRLRLFFYLPESKRELPLLDKWVELEIR